MIMLIHETVAILRKVYYTPSPPKKKCKCPLCQSKDFFKKNVSKDQKVSLVC